MLKLHAIAIIHSNTSSQLNFIWATCAFKNFADKSNAKFDNKPVKIWYYGLDMINVDCHVPHKYWIYI